MIGDVVGFDILPGSDDVYNSKTGKWDKLAGGPNHAPNCAYLGWGIYVMARVNGDEKKHKAAWSAAAHVGGKDLSLWTVMYPSGFQVHRTSHSNIDEWVAAGYDRKYITSYLNSQFSSYNHPNRAVEPRIPGIFQYYSIAEDELTKIFAGKIDAQSRRQQYCRSVGKADRPDRPREADRALQGVTRRVDPRRRSGWRMTAASAGIACGASRRFRRQRGQSLNRPSWKWTEPKSIECDPDAELVTARR